MDESIRGLMKALTGFGASQMEDVGILSFVFVMLVSLVSSIFIAFLYARFYSNETTGSQIHRSFPLLGVSITAIFVTIQFSLPLSLGLLGALSIVRFRTPIKEPEEIGFIMLVIASSISCATFNFTFQAVVIGVAIIGLFLLRAGIIQRHGDDGVIVANLPSQTFEKQHANVMAELNANTKNGRVESISKKDDRVVVSYRFRVTRSKNPAEFHSSIDAILAGEEFDIFLGQGQVG